MASNQLPDRRIDIQIPTLTRDLDECRDIDVQILEVLVRRPATTGYIAACIDRQSGYVSQRLGKMRDDGVVVDLDRGYYELHPAVCPEVCNGDVVER